MGYLVAKPVLTWYGTRINMYRFRNWTLFTHSILLARVLYKRNQIKTTNSIERRRNTRAINSIRTVINYETTPEIYPDNYLSFMLFDHLKRATLYVNWLWTGFIYSWKCKPKPFVSIWNRRGVDDKQIRRINRKNLIFFSPDWIRWCFSLFLVACDSSLDV